MKSLVPLDNRQLSKFYARKLPKYFTTDEVHEILSANVHDPKAYLLVNALWKTGARISELLQLHATDLDPAGRSIRLTTLKAGIKRRVYAGTGRPAKGKKSEHPAERILIIPDDLMVDLVSVAINESTRIFPYSRATAYRIVLKACTQAGINDQRAHPHSFRHSYAVHLLRQGVSITTLKEWMGHSTIASTLIYLRITQPDARAIFSQVRW